MSQKITTYISAWVVVTTPLWMLAAKPQQSSETRDYIASGREVTEVVQKYLVEHGWKEGFASVNGDMTFVFKDFNKPGKAKVIPDKVSLTVVPVEGRPDRVHFTISVYAYWSQPSEIKYDILDRLDARWKQIK